MPKKVKKTRVRVNVAGNEIIQSFDGESLKGLYKEWKTEQSKAGNLYITGQAGEDTVLGLLEKHGIVGRGGVGSAVDNTGAGNIIDVMNKILLRGSLISEDEEIKLKDVLKDLTYAEANNNPKDIPFRVPIFDSYNESLGKWEWETVHGHYRTPGYIQKRTSSKEEGGDEAQESIGPAPASFFSGQPPMWKALFGPDGFQDLVKDVIPALKSSELNIPLLNIREAGAAQAILDVEAVQREITNKCLGVKQDDGTYGDEFRKTDGTYNGLKGRNTLQSIRFTGGKDDKLVKRAAKIEDIIGDIGGYKINVTPLMMRKMAVALGFDEKAVSEARAETKEDIGKSWTEILKAKRCPKCGSPMKRKGKGWRKEVGEWYCPKCGSKSANFKSRWAGPRTPPPLSHRGKEVYE